MSVLSSRRWANVSPTYIAVCLVSLWRGLPIRVTHATEPAHHRAARLCAARWCAARLCVIRLGCVEGHPWYLTREGELWGLLRVRRKNNRQDPFQHPIGLNTYKSRYLDTLRDLTIRSLEQGLISRVQFMQKYRHMSVTAYQISGNSVVCSTA